MNQGTNKEKVLPGKVDEFLKKNWPTAKEDMEKGIQETKKLLAQGEKHLGELTDKSLKHLRITVLNHRKDKLYHDLGKLAASLPRTEWAANEKLTQFVADLNKMNEEIISLEKELGIKR